MTTNNNPTDGFSAIIAARAGVYWKELLLALALAGSAVLGYSWLKAHDAWLRFQAESQLKDQQIAERDRQAAANRATIEQLKQRTQTPQQIAAALPQLIQLPQPVTTQYSVPSTQYSAEQQVKGHNFSRAAEAPPLQNVIPSDARGSVATECESRDLHFPADDRRPTTDDLPSAPIPQNGGLYFPPADAKPLFDRLADCKVAENSLAACQANFADMKRERDTAVRARKGGFWQRAKQIGIGLAIGGAIGYAAHK